MESTQDRVQRGFEQFVEMAGADRARQLRDVWGKISRFFYRLPAVRIGSAGRRGLDAVRARPAHAEPGHHRRPDCPGENPGAGAQQGVEMALRNGATREEIRVGETMLQMAFYAGFPSAWEGLQTAEEIFRKTDRSVPED